MTSLCISRAKFGNIIQVNGLSSSEAQPMIEEIQKLDRMRVCYS